MEGCNHCCELFTGDMNEDLIVTHMGLDIGGSTKTCFDDLVLLEVFINNDELELYVDIDDSPVIKEKVKIKYCPICGRRLVR